MANEKLLGLIGYPLSHSFSKRYFGEKFEGEGIAGFRYELFPLEDIAELPRLIEAHPNLLGLNVTIPYKEVVIPYLTSLSDSAQAVGAVNTILFTKAGLIGYNTDIYGFEMSLRKALTRSGLSANRAMVLGTGGAAKASRYVLEKMGMQVQFISRKRKDETLTYEDISAELIKKYDVIVNTTPLGMSPNTSTCPNIPYEALTNNHLLFDLVYNPEKTLFLQKGEEMGAHILNGLEMLHLQAEKAWSIWTNLE